VLISLSRRRPPVQIRSGAQTFRPFERPRPTPNTARGASGVTLGAPAPSSSQVRTPPFQGGSTGSNPVGATTKAAGHRPLTCNVPLFRLWRRNGVVGKRNSPMRATSGRACSASSAAPTRSGTTTMAARSVRGIRRRRVRHDRAMRGMPQAPRGPLRRRAHLFGRAPDQWSTLVTTEQG
jgi:hypothetical protein